MGVRAAGPHCGLKRNGLKERLGELLPRVGTQKWHLREAVVVVEKAAEEIDVAPVPAVEEGRLGSQRNRLLESGSNRS
ncbi:hypothetical protein ACFX19_028587 [Malus domestica]